MIDKFFMFAILKESFMGRLSKPQISQVIDLYINNEIIVQEDTSSTLSFSYDNKTFCLNYINNNIIYFVNEKKSPKDVYYYACLLILKRNYYIEKNIKFDANDIIVTSRYYEETFITFYNIDDYKLRFNFYIGLIDELFKREMHEECIDTIIYFYDYLNTSVSYDQKYKEQGYKFKYLVIKDKQNIIIDNAQYFITKYKKYTDGENTLMDLMYNLVVNYPTILKHDNIEYIYDYIIELFKNNRYKPQIYSELCLHKNIINWYKGLVDESIMEKNVHKYEYRYCYVKYLDEQKRYKDISNLFKNVDYSIPNQEINYLIVNAHYLCEDYDNAINILKKYNNLNYERYLSYKNKFPLLFVGKNLETIMDYVIENLNKDEVRKIIKEEKLEKYELLIQAKESFDNVDRNFDQYLGKYDEILIKIYQKEIINDISEIRGFYFDIPEIILSKLNKMKKLSNGSLYIIELINYIIDRHYVIYKDKLIKYCKKLELPKHYENELIVETTATVEYGFKYLNFKLKLKKSNLKINMFSIDYNKDNNEIENANCAFCFDRQITKGCEHSKHILKAIEEKKIEGSLSSFEIDLIFIKIEEEKRKKEIEKNKKESFRYLKMLEEKISKTDNISISNKINILPIINCISDDGVNFENNIEIKVGNDKYYVVKDIRYFLELINRNEEYSYGKNFKFKHNINSFNENSRKCIDILINYSYDSNWENTRYKTLSPKATQSIIEGYINDKIYINNKEYIVLLEDYIPRISIKDNNIIISDYDELDIVIGNDYDFICINGYIYKLKCDDELRYLIRFILKNNVFNMEYVRDDFSKKILSRVIDSIELDDAFIEEFSVKDLHIKAYFDYDKDTISLDTKYFLDDEEVNEDIISNNNFISKKYTKYKSIIDNLGFVNNEIKDIEKIGNFLTGDLNTLKKHCEVFLSNNIKDMKIKKISNIKSNVSYNTGMLDICFENLNFSNEELNKIINGMKKKVKYIKLSKDVIFETDEVTSNQLLNIVEEFNLKQNKLNEKQTIPLYQGLKLITETYEYGDMSIDDVVKGMLKEIANYKNANYDIPNEVKGVLRQYQINAFNWLKTLVKYKFCGILADDMGLGKTLEIITLILSDDEIKPSLIVSPKSLIYNWYNEFKKWAPDIKVKVISGLSDERCDIVKAIENNKKVIYISSYDSLRNDLDIYSDKKFRFCILDEAQFIKNHTTLKAQSVKQITSEIRFVLTGTPIENTVMDLWSLFDFLMPNYLYNYNSFSKGYEKEIINKKNPKVIKQLVKKITPFILRRTKREVLKDLPEKLETVRYAYMGEEQRKVYEAQLLKTRGILESKGNKIELLSAITRLRQICVHPNMFINDYKDNSCKIDLVMDLLDELIENNHKVLIFSQFTSIFEVFEEKFKEKGIEYFILTGKTNAMLRVDMAEMFNNPHSPQKVFLISLKAGGTGLNLVGADTVIQLDPWWNVAAENQASDRAHRIGQKNVVQVIKMICENSIEQKVMELQEAKKDIISQVISDNDDNISKLNDSDLKYLLY